MVDNKAVFEDAHGTGPSPRRLTVGSDELPKHQR